MNIHRADYPYLFEEHITNPKDGEEILEVATFGLEEACQRLEKRPDDGPLLAKVYKYAAAFREESWPQKD